MNGWTKFYSNDTNLVGSDPDVEAELVSWSQTPLKTMIACEMRHDDFLIKINGSGNYWQSDDYVVELAPEVQEPGIVVTRRLQKQIRPQDTHARLVQHEFDTNFELFVYEEAQENIAGIIELTDLTDKWLTLEIDLTHGTIRFKILDSQV